MGKTVESKAHTLVLTGETGEIVVRGRNVMREYENDVSANAAQFSNGWFRTGDLGHLDDAGYLFVTGRLKEIINRGGEKISPPEVDEALLTHPAVSGACTFPVPHPKLGEEVAAIVVLKTEHKVSQRDLQDHVSNTLADFKVPRHSVFRDAIPVGSTGKMARAAMAQALDLTELFGKTELAAMQEFSLARSPEEETLRREKRATAMSVRTHHLYCGSSDFGVGSWVEE